MCSLVVGLVSRSVCVSVRGLLCAIWAAALRTACSWSCAAAFNGSSAFLVRCHSSACVTTPLMVASLIKGSLKRCSPAWCAWFWVGQPFRCCRVSVGDKPTSVSLPARRGHMLKCSLSSGMVWSHGQRVCSSRTWLCLQGSHRAALVRNVSCSLKSWMHRFCRPAGTHAGRSAEW